MQMHQATSKGNNQRNTKEKGLQKKKQKCPVNPSTLQHLKTNGIKGLEKNNAVQDRKKITRLKVMNKVVGNTSGSGTSAKSTCQKSGKVKGGSKNSTKYSPPPKSAFTGNNKHPIRNKRNDTENEEEESVSTAGSSGEVTGEEISDEEEDQCDGREESSEGDSSEDTGTQRNTEQTAINSLCKDTFVDSKCSSSSELNISSAGLKNEARNKEISREDISERFAGGGGRTCGQCMKSSCTSTPAKESKYKMFKRATGDKQAQKDEKRRVKAEKQRMEKEGKQKSKEGKKPKKKPLKAEKNTSVTKENQSASSSLGKYNKTGEGEPALTKAIKAQNRIMHLKEKGKDFRNILAEEEMSESEPLVLESNQVGQHLIVQRKGVTPFHRDSGWIKKNLPLKLSLRKKLTAWTNALGISHWLSFKVLKQNRGTKKSKSIIVKHRMALRVTSKVSLVSKNTMAKEKVGEGGDAVISSEEKDTEAKCAVVSPRMNEPGKTKTDEISQVAPSPSAPLNMTETPRESISKPPKPGARLVLPVKPDLSLKSIRKPLPGDLSINGNLSQRKPDSTHTPGGSLNAGKSNREAALENPDGVSVLQAARRKIDPSQINLTKMSLSGGTIGSTQARGPEPERDDRVQIPSSVTQPFPNREANMGMSSTKPICDEDTDREVAQLMCEGGKYGISQPEVDWAGNPQMSGDPQVCSTCRQSTFATIFMQYLLGQPSDSVWFRTGCVLRVCYPTGQWRSSAIGQSIMKKIKGKLLQTAMVEGPGNQRTPPRRC